jgi:hypothetical protein
MEIVVNSTAEGAVYRSDGVRLYGLDAELEIKMQAKRDLQFEKEIAVWIEKVSAQTLQYPDDIAKSLKSGIVLCRLINAIQPNAIRKINTRPIALMEVENIQLYLKACWKLGVPSSDLFVSSDLFNQKDIPQVLQNVVSLARVVQTLPNYKGPKLGVKLAAPVQVKKWETVETNQVVYITDLKKKTEQQLQYSQNHPVLKTKQTQSQVQEHNNILTGDSKKQLQDVKGVEEQNRVLAQNQQVTAELEERNKILEAKVSELRQEITRLETKLVVEDSKAASLSLEQANKALAESQRSYATLKQENGVLHSKATQLQNVISKLEQQLIGKNSEISSLEDRKQDEIKEKLKGYKQIEEQNIELVAKVDYLQQSISKLERQALKVTNRQSSNYYVHRQDKATGVVKVRTREKQQIGQQDEPVNSPMYRNPNFGDFNNHHMRSNHPPHYQLTRTVSVHTLRKNKALSAELQKRISTKPYDTISIHGDIDLDSHILVYTKECMAAILFSQDVEFADVYALNELFRTDAGRRQFIRIIHQTMKEVLF